MAVVACLIADGFVVVGVLVGLSLVLQGSATFILSGVGLSDLEAGIGNCVYQFAAAVAGVVVGFLTSAADLNRVLHLMHRGIAVSTAAFVVLCWFVHLYGRFWGMLPLMMLVMASFGATLMGILPFCLQLVVHSAQPASENVSSGYIYLIIMITTATTCQLVSAITPLASVMILFAAISVEMMLFFGFPHLT